MITCRFFSADSFTAERTQAQRSSEHKFYQLLPYSACWNKKLGATDTGPRMCDCQDSQTDCLGYEASPSTTTRILIMDRQDLPPEIPRYQVVAFQETREDVGIRNIYVYRFESHTREDPQPTGDPTLIATLDSKRYGDTLNELSVKLVDSLIAQGYIDCPIPETQDRPSFVASVAAMSAEK